MNFSVYNNLPIRTNFVGQPQQRVVSNPIRRSPDTFVSNNELDKYLDRARIEEMVNANPVVVSILSKYNIKPSINIENFKRTTYNHSIDTKNIAEGIYEALPTELKLKSNLTYIQKGALLHDIGKVLIPESILNKSGKLSEDELEIMHQHSKLSEALLSSQNIEPEVLNIVKYHHQNIKNTGYPEVKNTLFGFDINAQIVSLADKYSALTEKRAYKQAHTSQEALGIIKQDVDNGIVDAELYNSLVNYVSSKEKAIA